MTRQRKQDPTDAEAARWGGRRFVLAGVFTTCVLLGGSTYWAATSEIAGAVIAPAVLSIEGERKVIQHPEGGVVDAILVADGDEVAEGDVLIRLDGGELRAQLEIVDGQLDELMAREARLEAEVAGAATVAVSGPMRARIADRPHAQALLDGQIALFEARRTTLERRSAQLTERALQTEQEIVGAQSQIDAIDRQLGLLAEEIEAAESLFARNLIERSRVVALLRESAELDGARAALVSSVAQLGGRIAEIEIAKLEQDATRREDAISTLRDVSAEIAQLRERRATIAASLDRIEIRAPQDGVVLELAVNTIGGVIQSAQPLLYLVPTDPTLILEARIPSISRDRLRVDQTARVLFPSFNQRSTPELNGVVAQIAADALTDEQTGGAYFPVTVRVSDQEFDRLIASGVTDIGPGLPAEVHVQTDMRTVASFLIKPFLDFFERGFREE